ncbi:hypothetical protein WJX81_000760 [Elliptochloris bilobata]|uniref:MYB transcription factor n=1 Tax=Elliptochloris bilobata TaxID=381761 RepID=A0AAW1R248_9CHLO
MSQPKKVKRAGPGGAGRSGFAKQKWTDEEEAALRAGVAKYGVGKWRLIQVDEATGPVLAARSNVDLKDKWRNLNMDTSGSRGDKRKKGRGRAAPAADMAAAAAEGGAAAAAAAVPALSRRKRKRRPERAPGAVSSSPPRPRPPPRSSSGGALRALQEAALGPDLENDEEFSPRLAAAAGGTGTRLRRRTRRPMRVSEDELEEGEEERARYEAAVEEEEGKEEEEEPDELEVDEEDESGLDDDDGTAAGYNGGSGGMRRGPTPDDMVVAAIISMQSAVGSHIDDILHWIENHYGGGAAFRRAVKLTLRRMVAAGRLESVAGRLGLYRLGGVVRQLTEGGSVGWPAAASAADAGPTLGDARTVVEAALSAARATAEAEEAAARATRLSEAADRYERDAEAERLDTPKQGGPGE